MLICPPPRHQLAAIAKRIQSGVDEIPLFSAPVPVHITGSNPLAALLPLIAFCVNALRGNRQQENEQVPALIWPQGLGMPFVKPR